MTAKLIALDLDGTTLNNNGQLSQKTTRILKAASHAGHKVVITTGRPDNISENFYDELDLTTPMINFNGGLIHIPHHHWAAEYQATLQTKLVLALLELKKRFALKAIVAEGKQFILTDRPFQDIPFMPNMLHPKVLLNSASLKQEPISVTLFTNALTFPALQQTIQSEFPMVVAQTWGAWNGDNAALEIVKKATRKSTGIHYLLNHFNMTANNVIAFGDDFNDQDMLESAGWGVAMANAQPAVKAAANTVIAETNDEDGVANYLRNYLAL
ncbi:MULTISPECIES: Cof-type HAD-IIB family hydrolase [Loigolactobacillus]|uniref:HAD family hydrolase n=1 Tax=Loigolactobacillus backii TaxID=375175 RepID=A0A192H0P4_9LACO|nr:MULTISPECIES: Cof-type HAD-IIB family hydrolase [Loigolactobacillus]ANK58806.1 HAD family hydrolase [Loigolactobacillus backii]ANK61531.1 HAD family hydrolase [Loigolactobacillus backii]ANK63796.1 HAD family hydrolase [Loigolactobacillus backii]ANK66244.1 HAD family hydrolase [Loigolactobacillus backii]ANK69271.1 HAD family hydrolase [Loigolactobacillus backii]